MNDNASPPDRTSLAREARAWVLRLESGKMDRDALDDLRRWVGRSPAHARAFDQSRALWLTLAERQDLFAGAPLPTPRRKPGSPPARRSRTTLAVAAIAASLVAALVTPDLARRARADFRTGVTVADYRLPDGSRVWLDAHSSISLDFAGGVRRVVLLQGNAYFTVRHAPERFLVSAGNGVVEDVGTSFEIRETGQDVGIAVSEGAVRVATPGDAGRPLTLHAGDRAHFGASGVPLALPAAAPIDIAGWRRKELMVTRASLSDVIHQIGRYRSGPTVILASIADHPPINGAFRLGDPDAALRGLAAEQGLRVSWLPGGLAVIRD